MNVIEEDLFEIKDDGVEHICECLCWTRRIQEKNKRQKKRKEDDDVYFFFDLFVLVKFGLIS